LRGGKASKVENRHQSRVAAKLVRKKEKAEKAVEQVFGAAARRTAK